jgi:hypothetical protein
VNEPILIVSESVCLKSSSSLSQKNLKPPSPPVLTHLKAISTLSPIQECRQSRGFTREMMGGSLLALRGILKLESSVTTVKTSSKSPKDGALKLIDTVTDIPGATSPVSFYGYFIFIIEKFSVAGGRNFTLLHTPELFVIFKGIS